jgi:FkbM family methyltransferase
MNARWTGMLRQLDRAPELLRCARACSQWLPLSLAYAGLKPLRYPHEVLFRDGGRIRLDDFFDLTTFWSIFFRPTYPVSPAAAAIVDAGANIGAFTLYAARTARAARILAIEPFGPTFERLTDTVTANRLSGRVTCLPCALGGQEGEAHMTGNAQPSQFRQVVREAGQSTVAVRVTTLAAILQAHGIEHVDVLKMDIEGGEYPALLGAPADVLRRIGRICLEYHPSFAGEARSKDALFDHLASCGFALTFDRPDGEGYGVAGFDARRE